MPKSGDVDQHLVTRRLGALSAIYVSARTSQMMSKIVLRLGVENFTKVLAHG